MLYNIFFAIADITKKQYLCTRNINHLTTIFMKTFFKITIECNGQRESLRVQSTKLRKFYETRTCGIYMPKLTIIVSIYQIDVYLYLTHRIELCGTCGKPTKQRRYCLHKFEHEVYLITDSGLLIKTFPEMAKVSVSMVENGVVEDGVVIQDNIK